MTLSDWFVFWGFIILIVIAVIISIRKKQTMFDFALDRQKTPAILVFATLSASFLGPGFTLGVAERGFSEGMFFLFVFLGFSIQTIFVGIWIAPRLRTYNNVYTVGDFMGLHYGKKVQFVTGIISILYTAGIVGVCASASGMILESVTGIPATYGIIIVTLFVITYAAIGGMPSVISTDVIQFVVLLIGISILVLSIYLRIPDLNNFTTKIPSSLYLDVEAFPLLKFIGLFLGFFLGESLVPPYTNRALISKDQPSAKLGFILAGVASILWFSMCITIGISARVLHPDIQAGSAFMYMAMNYLPVGLLGLMLIVLISIILSTISSFVNAGSVSVVRDILEPISFKENKNSVVIAKIATFIIGFLAIIFAVVAPNLIDGLLLAYTFWAPTVVLPMVIAVLLKGKVSIYSGGVSIVSGILGVIFSKWILNIGYENSELFIGVLANQIGFWTTEFIVNQRNKRKLA